MGGTAVSRMPGGSVTVGPSSFCFCRVFLARPPGRGEETRGVGGFVVCGCRMEEALLAASGTGGVGSAATEAESCGCFSVLAVLSSRGRPCLLATELASVVGELVWLRG